MPRPAFVVSLVGLAGLVPATADAAVVLLTRHDQSEVHVWDSESPGTTTLLHKTKCNDADYNTAEGSELGWIAEHNDDYFARIVIGDDFGLDAQYTLGQNGLTDYDYPKHITVFHGEVVVTSRNDGTLWRYSPDGAELGSVKTPAELAQGSGTDGSDLFVSLWNGGPSLFIRYSDEFTNLDTIQNPSGMGNLDNLFDLVHDPATDRWFGLATVGELGTPTESNTVLEFAMGGAVLKSYMLPFFADGIGRNNTVECGDTLIEGTEECDDGNQLDDDACTAACKQNVCGDGHVWNDVEDCDDADDLDTNACKIDCTFAFCGDGIVWDAMEACDDGNDADDDACTNTCALAVCGDGIVQPGEQCDDPDPALCQDCQLHVPETTTGESTTTTDDSTTTTTSDATSEPTATTTDAHGTTDDPHPATSSTSPDPSTTAHGSATDGHTGGTGDVPTTSGSEPPATTADELTTSTAGFSGTAGTGTEDGCACTSAPAPTLVPLIALLAVPRRRRRQ